MNKQGFKLFQYNNYFYRKMLLVIIPRLDFKKGLYGCEIFYLLLKRNGEVFLAGEVLKFQKSFISVLIENEFEATNLDLASEKLIDYCRGFAEDILYNQVYLNNRDDQQYQFHPFDAKSSDELSPFTLVILFSEDVYRTSFTEFINKSGSENFQSLIGDLLNDFRIGITKIF